ncbi:guanine nucleotide binding protein, alpha subunit [Pisolithus croceorrhizus]|nr:guanine nucleotide binding protein, alpha subunit [Pisolithus croceorrhizus]
MVFNYDASDPLAVITAAPPSETPEEKAAREEREAESRRISNQIDEELRLHKADLKKHEQMVKILLLGQSESGKSTTLKNFRMQYAAEKWAQERTSWRTVIQLNLVRSVNAILDAVKDPDADDGSRISFTERHQLLAIRLSPLRRVEEDLKRLLGAAAKPVEVVEPSSSIRTISPRPSAEFFVRSWEWRSFVQASQNGNESAHPRTRHEGANSTDVSEIIARCSEDIRELWEDDIIQDMVKRRGLRLEDSATFFLNASERIAARDYQPEDDDVLRARLRTLDIQEYDIYVDEGGKMLTWKLYDVGGSRTQRHAWLPYFEQVTAIIFLAPISCFDERLAEDPRVNRLEDSFILWKAICSSKLLRSTTLIMFLNKIDLLSKKIADGVMVRQFLPSYADRPNETRAVVKYLKTKFNDIARNYSPEPRACHIYATTVVDTHETARILDSVRDGIMREQLKKATLM